MAAPYPELILSQHPVAYYRLDENFARTTVNLDSGTIGAEANATNDLPGLHPYPGAIAGERDFAEFFDGACRTEIPWISTLNPPATQPFTIEGW
ncbi:MAG TPA: hypothetical protein VHH88_04075, partial [Verrucomicrobiae bacterium]|nr:hypothetical protein [Verrucomicrobiae bacterium]